MKNSTLGLLKAPALLAPVVVVELLEAVVVTDGVCCSLAVLLLVVNGALALAFCCMTLVGLGIPLISIGKDCTCTPAGISGKPNICGGMWAVIVGGVVPELVVAVESEDAVVVVVV